MVMSALPWVALNCICQAWKTISAQELTTDKNLFHSITIPSTTFSSKANNILFQLTIICLLSSCPILIFFSHGFHTEPQPCQRATNITIPSTAFSSRAAFSAQKNQPLCYRIFSDVQHFQFDFHVVAFNPFTKLTK